MGQLEHDRSPANSDGAVSALPVLVQRWRRYGHDRAYVQVEGKQVGYRDLKTARVHCDQQGHVSTIERATAHLIAAAPTAADYQPRHAQPDSAPASQQPQLLPDRDLTLNVAGAAARVQATAFRQAAPVRTFLARVVGAKTDERSWRIGADAEVEVANRMLSLGTEWFTLHAVPVGDRGSDIDHV